MTQVMEAGTPCFADVDGRRHYGGWSAGTLQAPGTVTKFPTLVGRLPTRKVRCRWTTVVPLVMGQLPRPLNAQRHSLRWCDLSISLRARLQIHFLVRTTFRVLLRESERCRVGGLNRDRPGRRSGRRRETERWKGTITAQLKVLRGMALDLYRQALQRRKRSRATRGVSRRYEDKVEAMRSRDESCSGVGT